MTDPKAIARGLSEAIAVGAMALLLAGCSEGITADIQIGNAPEDPQIKHIVFMDCLRAATGPQKTHYNDRAEVVEECRTTAHYASIYCPDGRSCVTDLPSHADVRAILLEGTPNE